VDEYLSTHPQPVLASPTSKLDAKDSKYE
jgi:hypothetical protein